MMIYIRKILCIIICILMLFSITACSQPTNIEKTVIEDEKELDIDRAKDVAEQYCRMLLGKFSSMKSIDYTGENYVTGDTITFLYDVKYESNINKKGLVRVLKDTTGSYKVTRMDEEMY